MILNKGVDILKRRAAIHIVFAIQCFAIVFAAAPSSGAFAADMFNGKKLYAQHCAQCHGENGTSVTPNTPEFRRGEGLMQSDADLLRHIQRGKRIMPAFRGLLSDQEILDIIAHLRTLY